MTKLTVIEAAREGYAGRATIYRKLKAGLLDAEAHNEGTTVIESAELIPCLWRTTTAARDIPRYTLRHC